MELKKYKKIDIAKQMLETALDLYSKGEDYFSVLDLAGAAEEILGQHLKFKGITNSLESEKEAFILINKGLYQKDISDKDALDFLNRIKNAIKHMGKKEKEVIADPKEDAESMLDRAITNWWRLQEELTPKMNEFWIEGL